MTLDPTLFYFLGSLGLEQPLSNNDADVSITTETHAKEVWLPTGKLKRYVSAQPSAHWRFHYKWIPSKARDVFDGGLSREQLFALYQADQEMSFLVPTPHGQDAYTVRFALNGYQESLLFRSGDTHYYDVSFELVQTQPGVLDGSYSATILRESKLMRYYKLSETGGLVAQDVGPFLINGAYAATGVTLRQPGCLPGDPKNTSGVFDSNASGLCTIPSVNITNQPFTIEMWAFPSSFDALENILLNINGPQDLGNWFNFAILPTQAISIDYWGDNMTSAGGLITQFAWNYVVATQDGVGNCQLFVNAVLVASGMHGPFTGMVPTNTTFGGLAGTTAVQRIDEVAIYLKALTQTDVSRHYAARFTAPLGV